MKALEAIFVSLFGTAIIWGPLFLAESCSR